MIVVFFVVSLRLFAIRELALGPPNEGRFRLSDAQNQLGIGTDVPRRVVSLHFSVCESVAEVSKAICAAPSRELFVFVVCPLLTSAAVIRADIASLTVTHLPILDFEASWPHASRSRAKAHRLED